MTDLKEIAFLAGFLEGDGSFVLHHKTSPQVQATQKEKEPLGRLQHVFGGTITQILHKKSKFRDNAQYYWYWKCESRKGAACMMTIYSFMGMRRKEQIKAALTVWKDSPRQGWTLTKEGRKTWQHV